MAEAAQQVIAEAIVGGITGTVDAPPEPSAMSPSSSAGRVRRAELLPDGGQELVVLTVLYIAVKILV